MRAMAHARFTAVGRVALRMRPAMPFATRNIFASPFSSRATSANAYAAAIPMAGAPRTTMFRIAFRDLVGLR